jgi:hypothetical protein
MRLHVAGALIYTNPDLSSVSCPSFPTNPCLLVGVPVWDRVAP